LSLDTPLSLLIVVSPLWHSTMSVRPLPGASYHTFDTLPYSDIEAVGHFDTLPGYDISPFDEKHGPDTFHHGCRCKQHLRQARDRRQRRRCGAPVLLSVIVLCCLAFVVSAFWKYPFDTLPLPDVPGRHVSLADRLSSTFQTQSQRAMVNEHYESALEMIDRKIQCSSSSSGCDRHQVNIRHSLLQTFTLENPSLHHALVGESALVLHWQGTNNHLKPVLITNSPAVLDVTGAIPASGLSSPCGDEPEHFEEVVDVQSGVGLLIAAEELLRSGYQPSRTLVLSIMLGDASDAPKVSQYLHDTYGESGLDMEFELPPLVCKDQQRFKGLMLRVFHTLVDGVSGAFGALIRTSASSQAGSRPFEADAPRLFRFALDPATCHARLTRLRVQMANIWVRLILDGDY